MKQASKSYRQPGSYQRRAIVFPLAMQEKNRTTISRQESGDSHALSLDTFFGASKESITAAGRDRRS